MTPLETLLVAPLEALDWLGLAAPFATDRLNMDGPDANATGFRNGPFSNWDNWERFSSNCWD
jgi:hypothetical protein